MEMKCENERFAPVTFVIKISIFLSAAESISGKIFAPKKQEASIFLRQLLQMGD